MNANKLTNSNFVIHSQPADTDTDDNDEPEDNTPTPCAAPVTSKTGRGKALTH